MKTHSILITLTAIALASCGKHDIAPTVTTEANELPENHYFLTTDLPPELMEGTPVPILVPGVKGAPIPPTASNSPGTARVLYRHVEPPPTVAPNPAQAAPQPPPIERDQYSMLIDNRWQTPVDEPLSTFSVDVDTASYTNFRHLIRHRAPIPRDAIRLEEMVNYFDYAYPQPVGDHPFAVLVDNAACPWNPDRQLLRVALQGIEIDRTERPSANLVFLLDVSGSMQSSDRLALVQRAMHILASELTETDTVSIVVYAGHEGLVLPPTACDDGGRQSIATAIQSLNAGGTTNGGAGIKLAYQTAREAFIPGGINRVILATDGDFNVGTTSMGDLVQLVAAEAKKQIDLTVVGVGRGNLNDAMLEAITNHGNGSYHYLDSEVEARRVFLEELTGSIMTIARDVKIQIEFNPAQVRGYRLLGYANRMLRKQDFSNDTVDAGDIGSGHTVTAFYEIETGGLHAPAPSEVLRYVTAATEPISNSDEWLTVKLRYKRPEGGPSILIEHPHAGTHRDFDQTDADFRFATAVAMTAMMLRNDESLATETFATPAAIARTALGQDPHGRRSEFIELLHQLAP
jgi:Ca-activated chloride channel family protein